MCVCVWRKFPRTIWFGPLTRLPWWYFIHERPSAMIWLIRLVQKKKNWIVIQKIKSIQSYQSSLRLKVFSFRSYAHLMKHYNVDYGKWSWKKKVKNSKQTFGISWWRFSIILLLLDTGNGWYTTTVATIIIVVDCWLNKFTCCCCCCCIIDLIIMIITMISWTREIIVDMILVRQSIYIMDKEFRKKID